MSHKNFYITTTLPYVNSDPHIGFAMEIVRADVIARAKKLEGFNVFFNTGTDEHGQKLFDAAKNKGMDVQKYVDSYAEKFKDLKGVLNISDDVHFIRTTDEHHIKAAQEFWKRCKENGYIYKKNYQAKYCVGCELNKTDSELNEEGECPIHPNNKIELIDEDNYFFEFSSFQGKLLQLYESNPTFVIPDFRFNEIKAFVKNGLEDFSISRLKSKMSWGVPVPDDPDHVMYVWFDALVNYISTLGWPEDKHSFDKFWADKDTLTVQYCGKDNLRQQSAMWQAMLMAADLPNTKQIVINGFITGEGGVKMSKSIGNVINPIDIVNAYGTDALRYFLLRELSPFEDSPFTIERFKESYNANLANGLGNLVSRVLTMAENNNVKARDIDMESFEKLSLKQSHFLDEFKTNEAMNDIWHKISEADTLIQVKQPFKLVKTDFEKAEVEIKTLLQLLIEISVKLRPFLPETSKKIEELIKENKKPETPLFLRKD
ncbi:MAG: methionine--tRNA ligase [Candidatus Pacebacteria bacterium]|nr:methionine--tRNA ligase [Candidatus Paceibacterota bacterium]MBP9839649.1 methionine--tRNA ligase [Candidatus Paceibacterota bacterium]